MATLEAIPLELLFQVFDLVSSPYNQTSSRLHPLNSLAAASRYLDSIVEEYTRALLKQRAKFAPKKKSKTYTSRKKWLAETCQFCYRASKRQSILWGTLTCCKDCDREKLPKETMTNAIKYYHLSKLDLFTPNRLHPTLPPLAHGEYSIAGGVATLILQSDLIARRDYIHGCLSGADRVDKSLRSRIRRHNWLIEHMGLIYSVGDRSWYQSPGPFDSSNRASMRTQESRNKYVKSTLEKEWVAMNMRGASEEDVIELN